MEKVKSIINGSFNPRFTQEDFKELCYEEKRSMVWNIMVSMGFAHCFKDVDPRCFEKLPGEFNFSYINEENVDELYVEMRAKYEIQHNRMKAKTRDLYYSLGERIYETQRELGFSGYIEMDVDRLCGYVNKCGSWNDFKHSSVQSAISKMDRLAPRRDYGINNPNTGGCMHKWKSVHGCEYIVLEWDFIDAKDCERVKKFYENEWRVKGREIKVDSERIEVEPLDDSGNYYSVRLIWWWD